MSGHLNIVQAPMSLVKGKEIKDYALKTVSSLNLAGIHLLVSSAFSQAKHTPSQSLLPS